MLSPLRDRKGIAGVYFALAMPILLGFTALGTEVGSWYFDRRALQTAADMAAVTAAFELIAESDEEYAAALQEAQRHGFEPASGTLTLNHPPLQGAAIGDPEAVEVIVTRTRAPMFSALFNDETLTLSARGTARLSGGGSACVLALDPSASQAFSITGSAVINAPGCVLASNSSNNRSMTFTGSINATLHSIQTVGSYRTTGSINLNTTKPPRTGTTPLADPYADLDMPPAGPCNQTSFKKTGTTTTTISPGRYCGGIDVSGSSIVHFQPGTYVVDGGSFSFTGSTRIDCPTCVGTEGVTIVLTGSGSKYASVSIAGSVSVSLQAPTTGAYAGMLFVQDRNAPSNGSNSITGSASMRMRGALYFPSQSLAYAGSSASNATCTQIVARTISIVGSAAIGDDCDDTGVETINVGGSVQLIE